MPGGWKGGIPTSQTDLNLWKERWLSPTLCGGVIQVPACSQMRQFVLIVAPKRFSYPGSLKMWNWRVFLACFKNTDPGDQILNHKGYSVETLSCPFTQTVGQEWRNRRGKKHHAFVVWNWWKDSVWGSLIWFQVTDWTAVFWNLSFFFSKKKIVKESKNFWFLKNIALDLLIVIFWGIKERRNFFSGAATTCYSEKLVFTVLSSRPCSTRLSSPLPPLDSDEDYKRKAVGFVRRFRRLNDLFQVAPGEHAVGGMGGSTANRVWKAPPMWRSHRKRLDDWQ